MTTYEVVGLNFPKFLSEIERRNISLNSLVKLSHDRFCVEVALAQKKKFLNLCSLLNMEVVEKKIPAYERVLRGIKCHVPLTIFVAVCVAVLLFSQMFVFRIEVFGETTVSENEIVSVLKQNGFDTWKMRGSYNTQEVERVLTSNIPKISFASCVVRGGTLVVNVYEKIDAEKSLSAGKPIVAPCDLIIEEIFCTSGTVVKHQGQTAKAGESIVENFIMLGQTKIDIPAHAIFTAKVEQSISQFLTQRPQDDMDIKKVVEENKRMLYNMLSEAKLLDNIEEETELLETENGCLVISRFRTKIEISS